MAKLYKLMSSKDIFPNSQHYYVIDVPDDFVEIASMEPTGEIKFRFVGHIRKKIDTAFREQYYLIGNTGYCQLPLAQLLLNLQGYVHPLLIQRAASYDFIDLIDYFDAESDAVVVQSVLSSMVWSKQKEINTLLAIHSPDCILQLSQEEHV